MIRTGIILWLGMLLATHSWAQSTVTATVPTTTVTENDRIALTIEVSDADVGDIEIPREPWTTGLASVTQRPAVSRTVDIVDGEMRESVRYRWTYRPIGRGEARIEGVDVLVRGETLRTDPIDIRVVSSADLLQDHRTGTPETVAIEPDDVFIEASASNTDVYVNEQVMLTYRLYYRQGVQLRQSRMSGSWDTPGFWREEMNVDLRPNPDRRIVNGLHYNSIVLKRVAAYPTRDGALRIEPLRIESEVRFRAGDPRDPFFAYRSRFRTLEIRSNGIDIQVRPLPSDAPASFTGAVGTMSLRQRATSTALAPGDPITFTLDIGGTGNFAMFEAPSLAYPEEFDSFAPTENLTIDRTGAIPVSRKTTSQTVVPTSPGDYLVPPAELTYFNASAGQYVTLTTDSTWIRVRGEPLMAEADTGLAGVVRDAGWSDQPSRPLYREPWAYAPLAVPLAAWLFIPGVKRARRRHTIRRSREVTDRQRDDLIDELRRIRGRPTPRAISDARTAIDAAPASVLKRDHRGALLTRIENARYAPQALRRDLITGVIDDAVHLCASPGQKR